MLRVAMIVLMGIGLMAWYVGQGERRDSQSDQKIAKILTRTKKGSGAMETQKAIFAAGCFWGVEASFRSVDGVSATTVGYTGGHAENPTYKEVCSGRTGHAEAVLVEFDPQVVSYEKLLHVFWSSHDPTTLNRQGPDVGTQYRSAIFYRDEMQRQAAEASFRAMATGWRFGGRPIVTQIEQAGEFWPAEEYHQQYLEKRGLGSCAIKVGD